VCPDKCRSAQFPCQHSRHCKEDRFCDADNKCRRCQDCGGSRNPLYGAECGLVCPVPTTTTTTVAATTTTTVAIKLSCPQRATGGKAGCVALCGTTGQDVKKFTKKLLLGDKTCRNACECAAPAVEPVPCPPQAKEGQAVCEELCAELDLPFVRWSRKLTIEGKTCWNACECEKVNTATTVATTTAAAAGPTCPTPVKGGKGSCSAHCQEQGMTMVEWKKKKQLADGKSCRNACSCCAGKPAGNKKACGKFCTGLGSSMQSFGMTTDDCPKRCQCECPKQVKNEAICVKHCSTLQQDFLAFSAGHSSALGLSHCTNVCQCSETSVFQAALDAVSKLI